MCSWMVRRDVWVRNAHLWRAQFAADIAWLIEVERQRLRTVWLKTVLTELQDGRSKGT